MSTERFTPHPAEPVDPNPTAKAKTIYDETDPAVIRHHVEATARASGFGLLFLAVVAPIANFILIPAEFHVPAAVLMLLVALVDIYLGFGISYVLDPQNSKLALLAAVCRVAYGFALAIACFPLFFGAVELFNGIWDIALIGFGLHLLLVAILGGRKRSLPIWICILVGIAGVGYFADSLVMPAINTAFELSTITFVGEVALMLWFFFYRQFHRQEKA